MTDKSELTPSSALTPPRQRLPLAGAGDGSGKIEVEFVELKTPVENPAYSDVVNTDDSSAAPKSSRNVQKRSIALSGMAKGGCARPKARATSLC